MAGIYIHIPYCRKACTYCNFHFSTSLKTKEQLITAICHELDIRKDYLGGAQVDSIYFGGGTPSVLNQNEIQTILASITSHYPVSTNPEITLEANPDDLNTIYIQQLSETAINRLSIGVQSFREVDLQFMNRSHTAHQAMAAILHAQKAGFNNISIDLIYGTPGLTNEDWTDNLQYLHNLDIPHFSAYALTMEEKTKLKYLVDHQLVSPMNAELAAQQFEILMNTAAKYGYDHYEISNFAKPGNYAIHNTNYWQGVPYLGIGPSAHSFNLTSRSWNVANNSLYIKSVTGGEYSASTEVLSIHNRINEYIMTSLRTMWGCSLTYIEQQFGRLIAETISSHAERYITDGHITITHQCLQLTPKGKLFADGIAADLFVE